MKSQPRHSRIPLRRRTVTAATHLMPSDTSAITIQTFLNHVLFFIVHLHIRTAQTITRGALVARDIIPTKYLPNPIPQPTPTTIQRHHRAINAISDIAIRRSGVAKYKTHAINRTIRFVTSGA